MSADEGRPTLSYRGLLFLETCSACPVQYDVFKDGARRGYFRMRSGIAEVALYSAPDDEFPAFMDGRILVRSFDDDPLKGWFDSDQEQSEVLDDAADILLDMIEEATS